MSVDLVPMPARGICRAHVGIPALWVAYPGLAAALEEDTDPATSGGLDELDRLGLVSDPGRSEAIETGPFARSVPAGSRLGLGR